MNKLWLITPMLVASACLYADSEQWQSNWFSGIGVNPTSISALDATNGTWSGITSDNAELSSKKLVLDVDSTLVTFTPTTAATDSKTAQKVTAVVTCTPITAAKLPDASTMADYSAQVGFAVQDDGDSTYSYVCWVGGDNWVVLGDAPSTIKETEITVGVLLQYWTSSVTATFTVGGVACGSAQTLTGTALTNATANYKISSCGIIGSGTLASLNGDAQYAVAKIGDQNYGTVQAAVNAAAADAKVEVLKNVDSTETITYPSDKNVVIDAKGNYVAVDVPAGKTMPIAPQASEFTKSGVTGASGSYILTVGVEPTKATITLPDSISTYKQVKEIKTPSSGALEVVLETHDNQIPGKAVNRSKMRAFLATHASTEYEAAQATSTTLGNKLATKGSNGLTLQQSYQLGMDPDDSVAPEIPAKESGVPYGGSESDYVQLAIPAIGSQSWAGNSTITYSVYKSGEDTAVATGLTSPKIPISSDGGTYTIKAVATEN